MKVLFVLLVVALLLAAGVWKTQNPDGGLVELRQQAETLVARLGRGMEAVRVSPGDTQANDAQQISSALAQSPLVTELTARLDTLEAHIDALTEELADREPSPADEQSAAGTDRDDAAGNAPHETIAMLREELQKRIAGIEERLGSTDETQQSLAGRLDEQSRRIDSQSTGIDEQRATADELRARSDEQQQRLAQIETALDAQTDRLSGVTTRVDEHTGQFADLASTLEQQQVRLNESAEASAAVDGGAAEIAALEERLAGIESSLEALESQRSSGAADVPAADDSERTPATSTGIGKLQEEISTQIAMLQQRIDETDTQPNVAALTAALERTRARIEDLEQQMLTLPGTAESDNDTDALRETLQQQMQELESRLDAAASEPDAELIRVIDEVKAQINQLASQSYVTKEEFEARRAGGRTNEYKVFFNFNSTDITEEAAAQLDDFIAQEQDNAAAVSIFGLTDRIGPAEYNQLLAERRARRVRSYLIQNGFDYTRIQAATGLGEDAAASILDDEQEDAQQRAVVLFAEQP